MRNQSSVLTGIVCPPCKLLIAACASAWLENFTKAQPVRREKIGERKDRQRRARERCGEDQGRETERRNIRELAWNITNNKMHSLPLSSCYLVYIMYSAICIFGAAV